MKLGSENSKLKPSLKPITTEENNSLNPNLTRWYIALTEKIYVRKSK